MPPTDKRKASSAAASFGEEEDPSSLSSAATKKSRADVLSSEATSDSITDILSHLHNLFQTKEKELKEREADFDRRVKAFESAHPTIGSNNDVIQLNVGGQTNISVLRATLTQFEDSMLAAKFSGRWDDSMEKDRDGNIFLDEDPEDFNILIKYLRLRAKNRVGIRPKATYAFCSMLEYYNLMPGIYGQTWVGKHDTFTCEEISYGTVSLSKNLESHDEFAAVVFSGLKLLEFTVEFEKGATGFVGWMNISPELRGMPNIYDIPCNNLTGSYDNSLFLNITERKAFGPKDNKTDRINILGENLRINHIESATKVICRLGGASKRKYLIELADGTEFDATLTKSYVWPIISFSGKVIVSGLKYDIDELL